MAGATILARIAHTIVDIQFAILSLKSNRALTVVRADHVSTGGSILTRCRVAFVDLDGAIAAGVAFVAATTMTVADILTGAVVAQQIFSNAYTKTKKHLNDYSSLILLNKAEDDVLPLRRAASLQDTISTSHTLPVQPGAHTHWYKFSVCLHVAPFMHGSVEHQSITRSQLVPV